MPSMVQFTDDPPQCKTDYDRYGTNRSTHDVADHCSSPTIMPRCQHVGIFILKSTGWHNENDVCTPNEVFLWDQLK